MDLTTRKLRVEDFQKFGRFADVQIPYHPPVPKDIMEYKFRTKEGPKFTYENELRFLQHIHELKGIRTEVCEDCGQHLVNCGSYIKLSQGEGESSETKQKLDLCDSEANITKTNEDRNCECDVQ
jgi:hypothetical protein